MPSRELIVCVDDEEGVLRALRAAARRALRPRVRDRHRASGDEALELFDELTRDGERSRS